MVAMSSFFDLRDAMRMCLLRQILFGVLFVLIGGCKLLPFGGDADRNDGADVGGMADYVPEGEPKIVPGLMLRVGVTAAGAPAVQENVMEVNANGEILLPLIGAVKCDELTLVELQDKLKEACQAYFIDPQVSAGFIYDNNQSGMKSPWGTVLVMGTVARPGPVNMPSTRDMTVTRALMFAGGVTPLADTRKVKVWRREQDGTLNKINVDIVKIGKYGRQDLDVALRPGDVIWVPESWY